MLQGNLGANIIFMISIVTINDMFPNPISTFELRDIITSFSFALS